MTVASRVLMLIVLPVLPLLSGAQTTAAPLPDIPPSFRTADCAHRRACRAPSRCLPAMVQAADGVVNGSVCTTSPNGAFSQLAMRYGTHMRMAMVNDYYSGGGTTHTNSKTGLGGPQQ